MKRKKKPSKDDLLRFKMAKLNGQYSGFVPCLHHAKMIKNRKITLPELIDTEKREELFPFPYGNSFK